MKIYLHQKELAARWGMSHRTLEQWRYRGIGPKYTKFNGLVRYPVNEIEMFEKSGLV